jgi:phage FluMu protein Com
MQGQERCPNCGKLLTPSMKGSGSMQPQCLRCDKVDPLKSPAARWAESPLAAPK